MQDNLWAVILAGGQGQRMTSLVRSWLGYPRPKQYCTFVGTRSMLQHTIDRAAKVVDSNRIVTVIGDNHLPYVWQSLKHDMVGRILRQPGGGGTGAGIVQAVTYVLAAHPEATFLILPSDHFFYPESLLPADLNRMVRIAETFDDRLVLLGAKADGPEQDYGWIEPDNNMEDGLSGVKTFWEKPAAGQAREFLREGYLWNTMVMAAKGRMLWQLGKRFFPCMMQKFQPLHARLRAIYTAR
jgi:mannose-1-phosphate guanylyltransferase